MHNGGGIRRPGISFMSDPNRIVRDLIGKPIDEHPEPSPAVDEWSEIEMAKAKTNGTYILNGNHFIMEKGQVLPDGAEVVMETEAEVLEVEEIEDDAVEERAEKAAPENRAKKSAPENR
jgi:hypothetical protein